MKKGAFLSEISYCDSRFYQSLILYFALLFFSNNLFSQSVENGEQLYKVNCTSCHAIDKKLIGPALAGVNDKYSQEWLIKWIKNSAEMIEAILLHSKARGFDLPEDSAKYLINRAPRDVSVLVDMIKLLDYESLSMQRKLTIPFIKTVLGIK